MQAQGMPVLQKHIWSLHSKAIDKFVTLANQTLVNAINV